MQKTCKRCGQTKPITEFSVQKPMKDGYRADCKACVAWNARTVYRKRAPCTFCGKPKAKIGSQGAKLCDDCRGPSEMSALREKMSRIGTKYRVRKSLAATLAVYDRCMACGKVATKDVWMHVDHCHTTGAVRGVLCFNCNGALGHLGDSIERLEGLIKYLKDSQSGFMGLSDFQKVRALISNMIAAYPQ